MAYSKIGLDYFSYDVNLRKDRKFNKAKIKYGYVAVDIYEIILALIYGDKGYYIEYSAKNNTKDDVVLEIHSILQGKYQPSTETICEVIEMLVECGLFSDYHFNEQGIITSKRIQETYYRATVERKNVSVDFDKWFLDIEEMKKWSKKHSILMSFLQNQPNLEDNRPILNENQPILKQSKVNKSKVNKSKEREELPRSQKQYGAKVILNDEDYAELEGKFGAEKLNKYIEQINDYLTSKGEDRQDYKAYIGLWAKREKEYKEKDASNKNRFINFTQSGYDYDAVAEREMKKRSEKV